MPSDKLPLNFAAGHWRWVRYVGDGREERHHLPSPIFDRLLDVDTDAMTMDYPTQQAALTALEEADASK